MNLVVTLMANRLGRRVRAPARITYFGERPDVPKGMLGTIVAVSSAGALVDITWDDDPTPTPTAFTSVEVLDDSKQGRRHFQ